MANSATTSCRSPWARRRSPTGRPGWRDRLHLEVVEGEGSSREKTRKDPSFPKYHDGRLVGRRSAVIVYHIAVTTAEDYVTRREPHVASTSRRCKACGGGHPHRWRPGAGGPVDSCTGCSSRGRSSTRWRRPVLDERMDGLRAAQLHQFVERGRWSRRPDGSRRVTIVEGPPPTTTWRSSRSSRARRDAGFRGLLRSGDRSRSPALRRRRGLTWLRRRASGSRRLTARAFLHVLRTRLTRAGSDTPTGRQAARRGATRGRQRA